MSNPYEQFLQAKIGNLPLNRGVSFDEFENARLNGLLKSLQPNPQLMNNMSNVSQQINKTQPKLNDQKLKNQQLGNFLLALSDTLRGVNPAQGVLQRQEIFQQQADERKAEEANANFLKLIEGTPYATLANAIGVDATRRVYGDQTIKELNAEPKTFEPDQFFRNDTDEDIVFMDKIIAPGEIAGFDFSGESAGISIPSGLVSTKTNIPAAQSNALAIANLYSNKDSMSPEQFNSQLAALGGVTGLDKQKFIGNLAAGLLKQTDTFGEPRFTTSGANETAKELWNLISGEATSELKAQKEILVDGIKYLDTGKTTQDGKKIVSKDGIEFVLDE
jgi:hypothetical protein